MFYKIGRSTYKKIMGNRRIMPAVENLSKRENVPRSAATDACVEPNGNGPLENSNNNPVIENANRTALFFGDWSQGSLKTIQDQLLNSFMPAWLESPVQCVLSQYGVKKGVMNPVPVEGGPVSSKVPDSMIAGTIEKNIANGTLPGNNQIAVFLPTGTSVIEDMPGSDNSLIGCVNNGSFAYHYHTQNAKIPYTVVPFPCSKNPNDFNDTDINNVMDYTAVRYNR
jgi:hypothetical protein